MEGVLHELVKLKPAANGLAIIIGNEISCKPEHNHRLYGTIKDLEAARDAFESLKFTTVPIRNASAREIIDIVDAASRYNYPICYRRLAFVFSGHGDETCIYAHDSKIELQKYIFDPWMPTYSPHLADIPKLFFFDACRGDAVDQGVVITLRASGPVPKGGRAPSVGNYLLAYATLRTMKAFEEPNAGGYWMQHLTKELQNDENIDKSLGEILTIVTDKVLAEMERAHLRNIQQPVVESTLRRSIFPIREAKGSDVVLNFPPHTAPQEILPGEGSVSPYPVVNLLSGYNDAPQIAPIVGVAAHSQSTQQQFPVWNQPSMYQTVVAHGNSQYPIQAAVGATGQPFVFPSSSDASSGIISPQSSAFHEGPLILNHPSMEVDDVPRQDYQSVLNQLSQLGKIKILDYFDEPEKYDGSRILYKSHVSLIHIQTGRTITGSSMLVESKSKAKDQAAQDAWRRIQCAERGIVARSSQVQEGKGSATSSATTTPTSNPPKPTSKVWKSKLEQHYDKKPVIKYVSKECPKGGFESTVFCPDIGYAEGVGTTKAAAENNAAYNAVKKLEMSGKQSDSSS